MFQAQVKASSGIDTTTASCRNKERTAVESITQSCCFRPFFFRVSKRFCPSSGKSNPVPRIFADGIFIIILRKKTRPLSTPLPLSYRSLCVLVNHEGLGGGPRASAVVPSVCVLVNHEAPVEIGGGGEKSWDLPFLNSYLCMYCYLTCRGFRWWYRLILAAYPTL